LHVDLTFIREAATRKKDLCVEPVSEQPKRQSLGDYLASFLSEVMRLLVGNEAMAWGCGVFDS
jgi:hypothetical protein